MDVEEQRGDSGGDSGGREGMGIGGWRRNVAGGRVSSRYGAGTENLFERVEEAAARHRRDDVNSSEGLRRGGGDEEGMRRRVERFASAERTNGDGSRSGGGFGGVYYGSPYLSYLQDLYSDSADVLEKADDRTRAVFAVSSSI